MALRIYLLGQPRITRDGHLVDLSGYRPLALLAYLLVTGKSYRREHLIDLFFDYPDDPQAALRWTLSKLRKAIGSEYLLADRQQVSFNFQSDYWLDVTAFEAGETDLYKGDFLEGLHLRDALRFEDWLLVERQRLRERYQAGLEQQLMQHQSQGDYAAVILAAQQLLKLDNLREEWSYALLSAYGQLGKRAAAEEVFENLRQVLRKELGMEPAPETNALIAAIREGRISANSALPRASKAIENDLAAAMPQRPPESLTAAPASPENRPRTGFPRQTFAAATAFGLFAVLLLVSARWLSGKSPAMAGGSTVDSQFATSPQAFAGSTVTIYGPYFDLYADLFTESMRPFEEQSGIRIEFASGDDDSIDELIGTANEPDIVIFPQPVRLAELARQEKIVDIRSFIEEDYLRQQYPEAFLELATVDGKMVGAWYSAGIKSLVWYPKQAFEARGYQVPDTWDELMALSDQIVADGGTPWCIGINNPDAPGWVGTDWVEDILLRTAPPETYDAWVRHKLPFNSPEVRRAFEIMGEIWLKDEYVYGGTTYIVEENIKDSALHLFEDPPGCYLHRQASFAMFFFPRDAVYGQDYDFFYLPPIDPRFGKPVLGGGDIFAMMHDRPEVRAVLRFLTTPESAKVMIQNGGFLSPHRTTPIEWFPTEADLRFAQLVLGADTYRFDASDLMPNPVGFGSFFRGIIKWVNGADLEAVLQEIDASWSE